MMNYNKFYASLTLVIVTFTLAQMVFADGGMIPKVFIGNPPESPNQRAVIFHENGKETMILQVKYKGDAKDFSWIIPLPALPRGEDIRTAERYLFE